LANPAAIGDENLWSDTSRGGYRSLEVPRDIYFTQVAHALWMDMSGSLPWRLEEWTDNELGYLLSSRSMFSAERLSPDDTLYYGVLATSKSGTLLLRRDQGDVAVFWDSLSRWL